MDPLPSPPRLHNRSRPAALPWRLPPVPAPPAMTADSARIGDLEVRAASVIGPGHRSDELRAGPRQDSYRLARDTRSEHLIAAVADGMSDSRHSDLAAAVAVSALVNTLRQRLDAGQSLLNLREDAGDIFLEAARQVQGVAEQRGWSDGDVRTVAAVAVVPTRPLPDGGRNLWFGRIGDASAWFRYYDTWRPLFAEKEAGFDYGRVQHYLPHTPDRFEDDVFRLPSGGGTLALTTDGVGDVFARLPAAAQWFHRQWAAPVSAQDLLLHIGFEAQQRNDDRTAVLLWWGADGPAGGAR